MLSLLKTSEMKTTERETLPLLQRHQFRSLPRRFSIGSCFTSMLRMHNLTPLLGSITALVLLLWEVCKEPPFPIVWTQYYFGRPLFVVANKVAQCRQVYPSVSTWMNLESKDYVAVFVCRFRRTKGFWYPQRCSRWLDVLDVFFGGCSNVTVGMQIQRPHVRRATAHFALT